MAKGTIHYFTTTVHRYTLRRWREIACEPDDPDVQPVVYGDIGRFAEGEPPPGTYVFTDLDRLPSSTMKLAVDLAKRVRRAGGPRRVANWPNAVMNRYELLVFLHRRGLNQFNCHRFDSRPVIDRFPVFLRVLGKHSGPASHLLPDATSLRRSLRQLLNTGVRREDILIVEFQETDRLNGNYLTYGAYCAFGRVFPADIAVSESWISKFNVRRLDETIERFEAEWVRRNPHAAAIAEVFRQAHIDWGRVDYSLHQGRLQVFEINTNPDLVADETWDNVHRRNSHVIPVELVNVRAAFRQLAMASLNSDEALRELPQES